MASAPAPPDLAVATRGRRRSPDIHSRDVWNRFGTSQDVAEADDFLPGKPLGPRVLGEMRMEQHPPRPLRDTLPIRRDPPPREPARPRGPAPGGLRQPRRMYAQSRSVSGRRA